MQALVCERDAPVARSSAAARRATLSGQHLRRQIVGTCSVVFVSFLIRAAYTTVFAFSLFLQNIPGSSDLLRCEGKLNDQALMLIWLLYTPGLFFSVVLICQPLALLVSLWGMTSGQMLAIMRSNYEGNSMPAV